ncbi:MAG: prepilin peptidase [Thaumarchaeota archaeon]|nr:prepilin peptidase [Nitrososphaerota archaeon]MDE1877919.1 prepilin peptidase [Nitrososphaerota archaeon]
MLEPAILLFSRQIIALTMLSVASYFDIKTRQVDDRIWLIFTIPGIVLYFLAPLPSFTTIFFLVIGIIIGMTWFLTRVFGQADGLAIIALAIVFPIFADMPVSVLVALATTVLLGLFGMLYNMTYNISDMLHGNLFLGINEKTHRKILAFFTMHRKRSYEKFVIPTQTGDKFSFHFKPNPDKDFVNDFTGYVSSAFPLVPFMLVTLVLFLVIF